MSLFQATGTENWGWIAAITSDILEAKDDFLQLMKNAVIFMCADISPYTSPFIDDLKDI